MLDYIDKKYFKMAISGPYRETDLDIAVKCPICGDSKHKRNSKRLHLFYKDSKTRIKCFNGGCRCESPMNMGYFLKLYYPNLFEAYKAERFDLRISKIKELPKTEIMQSFVDMRAMPAAQEARAVETPAIIKTIKESIEPINSGTIAFLQSRGLNYVKLKPVFGDFYSGTKAFTKSGKFYNLKNTLFIPISVKRERTLENMVGFYARDISEKRFVNNAFGGHFIPWNLNAADNDKPVYIFEAILDALSFYEIYGETNIIALCTNNINPKILDYIKEPYFCLDNDPVGKQTMQKYTAIGKGKFLIYPENLIYKDFNEMLLNNYKLDLNFENPFKANILLRF